MRKSAIREAESFAHRRFRIPARLQTDLPNVAPDTRPNFNEFIGPGGDAKEHA